MIKLSDVFPVGFNTWPLENFQWQDNTAPVDCMRMARNYGINFLDISPLYSDGKLEQLVGRTLSKLNQRDSFFVNIKCGLKQSDEGEYATIEDPDELEKQVKECLSKLNIDQFDCLQIYEMPGESGDLNEKIDLLADLRDDNFARYIGIFKFENPGVKNLDVDEKIDVLQYPLSVLDALKLPNVQYSPPNNVLTVGYDPLYGGLLSQNYAEIDSQILDHEVRKYHPKFSSDRVDFIDTLKEIKGYFMHKGREELSLESVALAWLIERTDIDCLVTNIRNSDDVYRAQLAESIELSHNDFDKFESSMEQLLEEHGLPEFVLPPPVLPRHSFERHVIGQQSG